MPHTPQHAHLRMHAARTPSHFAAPRPNPALPPQESSSDEGSSSEGSSSEYSSSEDESSSDEETDSEDEMEARVAAAREKREAALQVRAVLLC